MRRFLATLAVSTACLFQTSAFACEAPSAYPEYLLVGNKGEDSVSFINLETGREVMRRPVSAKAPHEIAISQNRLFAAVVNYGSAAIDVFHIGYGAIEATIDLGDNRNPHGLVAMKNGGFIATTEGGNSVVILTPRALVEPNPLCPSSEWSVSSIPTEQSGTHMVALSPDNKIAYTANLTAGTVSRIDLETEAVLSVPAGKEVEGIAVTQDGGEVWASIRGEDKVVIFDATTLTKLAEIPVGPFPLRIIASPDGQHMVTSNLKDGSISVLNVQTREVERTINVSGSDQTQQVTLLFSNDGKTLYAAETGANKIAEIDFESGRVIGRLSGGKQGDGLAIAPASPW